MDKEQLMRALGEIDDAYIMEAAPQAVRKRPRLLWPAAAACAALALALAGFLYHPAPAPVTQAPETTQSALLASLKNGGVQETAAREAFVPVEGRIAVYEQIGSGGHLADLTGEPFAETGRRLKALPSCKVNLIPLSPVDHRPDFQTPDEATQLAFLDVLMKAHIQTMLRRSRGKDVAAACGQLRLRETSSKRKE